jgi:crotonobetainyl-CoA:carnitine CoA-transferase CaiB-like acyl-CoA transferase
MANEGALAGVRVLELGGFTAAYAGKLFAEAGADVVRVVPAAGDPLAGQGPYFGSSKVSIQETWYNLGKRVSAVDPVADGGRAEIATLVSGADILLDEPGALGLEGTEAFLNRPGLARVTVSPVGMGVPMATADIVANALSGAASVTGSQDTPPLNGHGNQTHHTVGMYAVICGIAALRAARISGQAQHVDLSSHEALVSCTEQLLMQWFFEGNWPRKARRQGALHWSGAYSVYPDRNGDSFHITAAMRFADTVVPWLFADGMAADLTDPSKYPDLLAMVRDMPHIMEVLRDWVASKESATFFFEAQEKHLPWGPAWDVPAALGSPQIAARGYLQARELPGSGPVDLPMRLFRSDADAGPPQVARRAEVRDLGWDARPAPEAAAEVKPSRPLEGIRILDFTHVLAGPFGTRALADLGADVLKLGTALRSGGANNASHPYYVSWNRNKRSLLLDMSTEKGRDLGRGLAARSDAVIENFSAGVLKRWGMDRASLASVNPKVTVVSMGGMGQTGPWKSFVTFAPTIHALCGLTHMTNFPGRKLDGYGFSLTDHLSGLAGAIAVLEGIEHARRTGQGIEVDLAQFELGLGIMGPALIERIANGTNPEPVGNRHAYGAFAPHGIYPAAGEDRWVAIAVANDREWGEFCTVMGREELAADGRFRSHADRIANEDELDRVVGDWTRGLDRYDVMARCQERGVAAGAVQDAEDLTSSDQYLRGRAFFGAAEASGGTAGHPVDRFPARFNGERPDSYYAAHQSGADTFDILAEVLGLSDEEIASLMAEGILT